MQKRKTHVERRRTGQADERECAERGWTRNQRLKTDKSEFACILSIFIIHRGKHIFAWNTHTRVGWQFNQTKCGLLLWSVAARIAATIWCNALPRDMKSLLWPICIRKTKVSDGNVVVVFNRVYYEWNRIEIERKILWLNSIYNILAINLIKPFTNRCFAKWSVLLFVFDIMEN